MTESEAMAKMIAPGTPRAGKYRQGVIQINITRACDKACFNCTQGSNLRGPYHMISLDGFEKACESLSTYWGVVGMFGGNPALHPEFPTLCEIMSKHIPQEQRGIWCNNPITELNTLCMRRTFNPRVSNLNVHLDRKAFDLFREHWPESMPFGEKVDSRHSPVHLAMMDLEGLQKSCKECSGRGYFNTCGCDDPDCNVPYPCDKCKGTGKVYDDEKAWDLIADCDINKHWSAMICEIPKRGLRAYFCEIAGAQAILHANDPDWPDLGIPIPSLSVSYDKTKRNLDCKHWWELPMASFKEQAKWHCHRCAVPLRGYGELAQALDGIQLGKEPTEQTSSTHRGIYQPKRPTRGVEVVTEMVQLNIGRIRKSTDYLGNATK